MRSTNRQRGAIIVTVALTMLFLLGFMGIALDFGHMFIVKDELQTSMDACALAAAQELDGSSDAITRAQSAGKSAGNLNKVNFQSATWRGQGQIIDADITFKDSVYGTTTAPAAARYVQCQHTQGGVNMWSIQALGAFAGSTDPAYSKTKSVGALAVATRTNAQSTCPIPIGLHPKPGGTAPNYGFAVGEWVTLLAKGISGPGKFGWYPLNSGGSTPDIIAQLDGSTCGIKAGDNIGLEASGVKAAIDAHWNYRFGIYKNGDPGPSVHRPDPTGYAYTSTNWKNASPQNAYSGTPVTGSDPTAANYQTKRAAFRNYADNTSNLPKDGDSITGLNLKGGFKDLATGGPGGICPDAAHQHQCYGFNRRIVVVPVVPVGGNSVTDFACVLMLQPIADSNTNVQLEFLGNAKALNSPCTASGLAGGTAGPLVPVLVQ